MFIVLRKLGSWIKFYNTCFPAFFALILSILCTHSRCKIKYFRPKNVSDTHYSDTVSIIVVVDLYSLLYPTAICAEVFKLYMMDWRNNHLCLEDMFKRNDLFRGHVTKEQLKPALMQPPLFRGQLSIICVHNCGGSLFPVIPNSYLCRSFQAVYDGLHCALSCCYVYTSRSTPTKKSW
jgi:hypothetical protein